MTHNITLEEYLRDPCGASSLPWRKNREFTPPGGLIVVHERDFSPALARGRRDERYFRLIHRLRDIPAPGARVQIADCGRAGEIAGFINRCYSDISVDEGDVREWTRNAVFDGALWVYALDGASRAPGALGIAELDRETGEGTLEWIQTLAEYRGRGLARAAVLELLARMKARGADFATVSGRLDNADKPEALYRGCGFEGGDVWHVLSPG